MAELLYKLREWLTVPDAAAHLSIVFGEEVTEADVMRLGLDGHLTLSISLVNLTDGLLGRHAAGIGSLKLTLRIGARGVLLQRIANDRVFVASGPVHLCTQLFRDRPRSTDLRRARRSIRERRGVLLAGGEFESYLGASAQRANRSREWDAKR